MIGIVAEFNPYHEGHKYLIEQARLHLGDEPIVVCMSGDFVQRGEPAIRDKFTRAENTDADLIIELPLPWCLSSAEGFARGAVGILRKFGCKYLAFGTESGNLEDFNITVDYNEIAECMKSYPELSWPAARSRVIGSDILDSPNNILAFEYLKYIGDMIPYTVKRTTVHDGASSAKDIRSRMSGPDLETAVISRLKMFSREYYNELPDSSDGVGNRLYEAVGNEFTLEGIYKNAKSKRITESRIRRLVYCAALGVKDGMNEGVPEYARILYANGTGLNLLRNNHEIYTIVKPSDVKSLSSASQSVFQLGSDAHDFYQLGFRGDNVGRRGEDYRTPPIIV